MAAKYTFAQFKAQYPDDDACLWAIFLKRYKPDVCPQCGVIGKLTRIAGRRAYACKEGCHTYPCAGTIFEHSSTSLSLWFHAMYLMTATRNGVSGKELQRQLGVTYKCAYRIGQQLRKLMGKDNPTNAAPLSGQVEVDETFVGGRKHRSKARRHGDKSDKAVVLGMAQRGGPLVGQVVASTGKMELIPPIMENVAPGTAIHSDEWNVYKRFLPMLGYRHAFVSHKADEFVRGDVHTNTLEGFWSHLKRGIRSTHVAVSKKHLQKYVDEFAWRFNNRHDPAAMFNRLISSV